MLASIIIKIKPVFQRTVLPNALGREIRAFIYRLISEKDRTFSAKIHDAPGPRPFSVSLVYGKKNEKDGYVFYNEGNYYYLRITTLTKEIFEALTWSLFSMYSSEKNIRFYEQEFEIKNIFISPLEHPLASLSDFKECLNQPVSYEFTLDFKTPTGFAYGNGIMPLPLPYSIFRSYLQKWNSFCPDEYIIEEGLLKVVETHVFPSRYSLKTGLLDMKDFKMVGFIGKCSFFVDKKINRKELFDICSLVRFSFYSGTGTKTTMGMGQTFSKINTKE